MRSSCRLFLITLLNNNRHDSIHLTHTNAKKNVHRTYYAYYIFTYEMRAIQNNRNPNVELAGMHFAQFVYAQQ